MNKIICVNPPKFVKAILKLFVKKDKEKKWIQEVKIYFCRSENVVFYNKKTPSFRKANVDCYIIQKELRTVNFAGTKTMRANVSFFNSAGRCIDFDFLNVGRPTASGLSVAVADCVAAHSAFSAYTTNSGHILYLLIWTIDILTNINRFCNWFA